MLDLTSIPPSQLQTAAFEPVRNLKTGESVQLLFAEQPDMTLQSLNLRLRNNLSWATEVTHDGAWLATVHRAEDVPPTDVIDALKRDHKRLDALFSRVIHLTDRGELLAASQDMAAFIDGLRRHMVVEHDMLVRAIRTPKDMNGVDPSAAMMAEHDEILAQSTMILSAFAEQDASIASVSPLLAILAGYLAKHEIREELTLLPVWQRALAHAPATAINNLFERVLTQLEMNN